MDRLSALLTHFGVHAGTFFSGDYCGLTAFDDDSRGHIHLLQSGQVRIRLADNSEHLITEPTLIFFPRPYHHRLSAMEADVTKLVCATLNFNGGVNNPLSMALPDYLMLPLKDMPMLGITLDWLFREANADDCGRDATMDRLFELLVIQLLRYLLATHNMASGMMAGLADPRLSRALNQMHENPQQAWTVAELATAANMSRASFAAHFHAVLGQPPADYLMSWRISLAQKRLRDGKPIALIADEVGYESPSALARAFRRKTGTSPRDWLRSQTA
ncbi:MAG: cupin domain-containing protein [Pseudomonas sp.]